MHELVLPAQSQPEAAGFILRGIKGIFGAIRSIIAASVRGVDRTSWCQPPGFITRRGRNHCCQRVSCCSA